MIHNSLEDKLQQFANPVEMLRNAEAGPYQFPVKSEFTNWRDEQEAWRQSAVFFDQSYHMADHYFEGPDVRRLLEDVAHMDYRFSQTARYKGCACHIARTPFRVRLR